MRRFVPQLLCIVALAGAITAADKPARKAVRQDEPVYPEIAVKGNIHGTVKVRVWISPEGSVRRTEYVAGHPLLAEAAIQAVKNWKYERAGEESISMVELKF